MACNLLALKEAKTDSIRYKADPVPDPNLQKKQPWTFRKGGPYAKIHYNGSKWLTFDKLEGADFKYDNGFSDSRPKIPK